MTGRKASYWKWLPWLVALLVFVAVAADAWARVGGGQGYSGGGGHGGGGGGSSSSGDSDLIWFLIWLCIEHPAIGIPVVLFLLAVGALKLVIGGVSKRYTSHSAAPAPATAKKAQQRQSGVQLLRAKDPNFSEPLFIDFAQLVYARAQEQRGTGDREPLRPLMSQGAIDKLFADREGLSGVRDVIFGATGIESTQVGGQHSRIRVVYETNLTEARGDKEQQLLSKEVWTFQRRAGVLSGGPEVMSSLSCPSCGASSELRTDGTCANCDAVRTGGRLQWEVTEIDVSHRRPLSRPELHMGGGVEPGTGLPTIEHPQLAARRRSLAGRHPDFSWNSFGERARTTFMKLQEAWASGEWEKARPYQTDALFGVHRFWMDRYKRFGLRNRLEDVKVQRVVVAKVDTDAYFETVTVRIFASMRDWTEQVSDGEVVAGSKSQPRTFSEYWTFLRTIGGKEPGGDWNPDACPSCGAPLDNLSMAGVCGYCDAKITSGSFDWVVSRIEQDEAYAG